MAERTTPGDAEFEREYEAATREARDADTVEPRASAASYDRRTGRILVELRSGVLFGFRPDQIPGLEGAAAKDLASVRISPSGDGLLWDSLDTHVSLTGLLRDGLKLRQWAPRLMGQQRSEAKARAARLNGLKGGRPSSAAASGRKGKGSDGGG